MSIGTFMKPDVSATTLRREELVLTQSATGTPGGENEYYPYLWTIGWPRLEWAMRVSVFKKH